MSDDLTGLMRGVNLHNKSHRGELTRAIQSGRYSVSMNSFRYDGGTNETKLVFLSRWGEVEEVMIKVVSYGTPNVHAEAIATLLELRTENETEIR